MIYDIGANNGDDIPYYLIKADKVVAVEANPRLARAIATRFALEIEQGRLILENCVMTSSRSGTVDFYIHNRHHVLSQAGEPTAEKAHEFTRVQLPAKSILELIAVHGQPHYIKIDIEGADGEILAALFEHGVYPDYVSAESHSLDIFCLLAMQGGYKAFKLVDGPSVANLYAQRVIQPRDGVAPVLYSFPHHSAGPMGEDIDGEWLGPEFFFRYLALEGFGWKDIHASRCDAATFDKMPDPLMLKILALKRDGKRAVFRAWPQQPAP
ncbi:MAG: FkbM family methyltransferase [Cyanobium sp.]